MQTTPTTTEAQCPFIGRFNKLKLSPEDAKTFIHLSRLMKSHLHVYKVHYLFKKHDFWVYVIETTFESMPRFIMGKVDPEGTKPEPITAAVSLECFNSILTHHNITLLQEDE